LQNPELKGDRLFKGLRGKIHGIAPEKAVEALAGVLSVVVRNGVQIFHGAIDRAGHAEQWSAYRPEVGRLCVEYGVERPEPPTDEEAALLECLERLDAFAHTYMPKESILWIADKSGFEKSVKHGLKFFQLISAFDADALRRLLVERARQRGVADFNLPAFDHHPSHVVDTIYFGDSHESLALQLADVCCATIVQHLLGRRDAGPFYNLIRRQIVTDNTLVKYSKNWTEAVAKERR
jgi:hypothetical protein